MELREPPRTTSQPPVDPLVRPLLLVNLLLLFALGAWLLLRPATDPRSASDEHRREVASKLKAAGVLDEAAELYEQYLLETDTPSDSRGRIAYSLGTSYLESGRYEKALRWFYEAESLGVGDLSGELGAKIVHALERLGRYHAAQAALGASVSLDSEPVQHPEGDPVVAKIDGTEIHRSELDRALQDLPPELARGFASPEARAELLKKYVADELLWRKATKLEYDQQPDVRRQHAALLKQLTVSRFVEREVLSKIEVDEADLSNYFEANRKRYQIPAQEGEPAEPRSFEEARALVERDYRRLKMQTAYQELIDSELATAEVELYPERMTDGD
jgi:tetratricopeptide (TPR) repeat protein